MDYMDLNLISLSHFESRHYDMTWKRFQYYWFFVGEIHQ